MTVAESKKFSVGDKVVVTKDTPQKPEGWVGFITNASPGTNLFDYYVQNDVEEEEIAFYEHELELLASLPKELPMKETIYTSALDKQVSGNHYKDCGIQPIEYIHANGLSYFQGNVVKYVTRYKDKAGKADLEKAIHYLELIIELEYSE